MRNLRNRLARRAQEDDGFSLAEVLVAFVLFMILAASTGLALISAVKTTRANEGRVVAANLVARKVETLRGLLATEIPDGRLPRETVDVDGMRYYLDVTTSYDTVGGTGSACSGSSGKAAFKRIRVSASWDGMGAVAPVLSETTKALPILGLESGLGIVTVPVSDRLGEPLRGVPVTLAGRTVETQADGCAIFSGLAPGAAYAATINVPGYVDRTGLQQSARSPIQVTAGEVTKDPGFVYDRAATVTLTVRRASAPGVTSAHVVPAGLGVTLSSTSTLVGDQPNPVCGSTPCVTASGDQRARTSVFPFEDGYRAWAGTCAGSRPPTPASITPAPGGSAVASLPPLAAVDVVTKRSTGSFDSGWTVTAVNRGCSTERFVLPGTTGTSNAGAVKISLPAGTWEFEAVKGSTRKVSAPVTLVGGQYWDNGSPVVVTTS
ncbi:prepilin-type N-terminal cleavage/methylation domain-containing protein [Thalassiella azotivora]